MVVWIRLLFLNEVSHGWRGRLDGALLTGLSRPNEMKEPCKLNKTIADAGYHNNPCACRRTSA